MSRWFYVDRKYRYALHIRDMMLVDKKAIRSPSLKESTLNIVADRAESSTRSVVHISATFPRFVRFLEVTNRNILQCMRASSFDIIQGLVVAPFEGGFTFRKEEKVRWGKVGAVGRLWNCHDAIFCQVLGNHEAGFDLAHTFLKTSTPRVKLPQPKPAGDCGVKRYQGRRIHYRLQPVGVPSGVQPRQDKNILIP
ncbi:hypothetical protein TNCV_1506761 [Trichonephila clavipes]|nr:hypothetical protein TNCV_1506761 [Trichonephila clavipes]